MGMSKNGKFQSNYHVHCDRMAKFQYKNLIVMGGKGIKCTLYSHVNKMNLINRYSAYNQA